MSFKKWWQSKTHWFNTGMIVMIAGLALMYIEGMGFDARTTAMISFGLSMIQTIGNYRLRQITTDAIER